MFALRRSAALALSSRVPYTIFKQSRSITTISTNLRICVRPTMPPVFQKRFVSEVPKESDEMEPALQDNMAPDATSAAQFDVSDVEPIEAREVPQEEPIDTAIPRTADPAEDRGVKDASRSPTNKIYLGNIYFDVSEEDLRREFSRFGTINKLTIVKDVRGMSKGFAYIDFAETSQATTAIDAMNQQVFEGRRLSVQYAYPRSVEQVSRARSKLRDQSGSTPPSRCLYIGNMSFDLTDQDLSKLFSGIKNVLDVRVAIDRRTGQPRGFAHADFTDIESAEAAYHKLNGKEVFGRTLRCDYSGPSSRVRPRSTIE